ncbi:MAG: NDP-sugar synthase [Sulfolobales archaeon]|nr:NDP-sugar synthase [Sulfolobales archaeon]MDW8010009.1 NDP-sugar synthase [Sulfolobales archaeon]
MKAVVIAGGLGKRLRPLTEDRPKCLVEVGGKPIVEWQIEWLRSNGVDTVIILAGHHRDKLVEFLGSGARFGVSVAYVVEDEPLGTGGAIKNAEKIVGRENFIAVNGDIITNIPARDLVKYLEDSAEAVAVVALVPLKSPYGIVEVDRSGVIRSFREKPVIRDHYINAGVYAMRPEIFQYLPERGDIEKETFPKLASEGRLFGRVYLDRYWRSIDTVKDVEEASREVRDLMFP